jgi:uncharacterized delta-60 repeat protein
MKATTIFTLVFLTLSTLSNAQISETWVRGYNGPGSGVDKPSGIAVDASGNVFVTGTSPSAGFGTEDYATIKYNSSGDQVWVKWYNGTGSGLDYAYAIAVDAAGNVYVTGGSWGIGTNFDYLTIKYNSAGDTVWTRRYNSGGSKLDKAYAIAVDAAGNVYVTGASEGTVSAHGIFEDYATVKYSPTGVELWVARYNGPASDGDFASSIALDASGNVYVTGTSDGGSSGSGMPYMDYATIKYNSSGIVQWVHRYNGPGSSNDEASCLKVDASGNVYVTGKSVGTGTYYDYATLKINAAGTLLWAARYTGPGSATDEANSLGVDRAGNVFVTGKSYGGASTNYDYVTIKYNSSGVQSWLQTYNGPSSGNDGANALMIDTASNVYVTGYSTATTTAFDYATLKYNSSGVLQWSIRYAGSGSDEAYGIFADNAGYVYVTGMSALDYATVKYSPTMTGIQPESNLATEFALDQNYPNPFNPSTNIRYHLLNSSNVRLSVYDINGREVAVLVNESQQKGSYEITFDASKLSTGVYFYKLVSNEFSDVKRMMLVK